MDGLPHAPLHDGPVLGQQVVQLGERHILHVAAVAAGEGGGRSSSRRTVNAYLTTIYGKSGVSSRSEAAHLAIKQRLV